MIRRTIVIIGTILLAAPIIIASGIAVLVNEVFELLNTKL